LFQEVLVPTHEAGINYETDTFKIGLIKSAANGGDDPAADDAGPAWTGGTTNYGTAECTPGGNYTDDGETLGAATFTEAAGVGTFDTPDMTQVAADGSNPTNARWGILYSSTASPTWAVGFIDLGADFDMTTGPLDIAVHASGWFTDTIS